MVLDLILGAWSSAIDIKRWMVSGFKAACSSWLVATSCRVEKKIMKHHLVRNSQAVKLQSSLIFNPTLISNYFLIASTQLYTQSSSFLPQDGFAFGGPEFKNNTLKILAKLNMNRGRKIKHFLNSHATPSVITK